MLIKFPSAAHYGIDAVGVSIEINIASRGFPGFDIVGLPNKSIAESRERVKTAIQNSGINFPSDKKIIINLAPADLPKEGSLYDLPIAVGIISAVKSIKIPASSLFFGELSLDGSLRHTKGAILLAIYAKENGFKNLFVPIDSVNEATSISGVNVYPVHNLGQLVLMLNGQNELIRATAVNDVVTSEKGRADTDFSEVLGQEQAKRALEIAAAGGHNVLLMGPPGVGKSMLAKAFCSILPILDPEESIEVTRIHSISGKIPPKGSMIRERPFRSPHHTISSIGLVGGGVPPKVGEVSLAHRGVLFLDEICEFTRAALESIRQPLEDGVVSVSRFGKSAVFPSRFILLAACNPCPCGYYNHSVKKCSCTPAQIERYRKKLSGPVIDRIDMQVYVRDVETEKISGSVYAKLGEKSSVIRRRVESARKIQRNRLDKVGLFTNSEMSGSVLKKHIKLSPESVNLLSHACDKYGLSARAYFKVIKLARTIADLSDSKELEIRHLTEAIQYRIDYY